MPMRYFSGHYSLPATRPATELFDAVYLKGSGRLWLWGPRKTRDSVVHLSPILDIETISAQVRTSIRMGKAHCYWISYSVIQSWSENHKVQPKIWNLKARHRSQIMLQKFISREPEASNSASSTSPAQNMHLLMVADPWFCRCLPAHRP